MLGVQTQGVGCAANGGRALAVPAHVAPAIMPPPPPAATHGPVPIALYDVSNAPTAPAAPAAHDACGHNLACLFEKALP